MAAGKGAAAETTAVAAIGNSGRLSAVRDTHLLDADSEEAFDRLTRLAVRLVGVPASFISLVDEERDFYLSQAGFAEPLATAREMAGRTFCHFAIQSDKPLVIGDTAAHPVYSEVPTVRALGVAAYVGVPIVVDGQPIGSFCVIDGVPRVWTDEEVQVLTELALSAQREIELRASGRVARETAARLTVAMEAAELGAWTHDSDSATRWHSADASRILRGEAVEEVVGVEDWLATIHPDDRDRVRDAFTGVRDGDGRYAAEYRVKWRDGSMHWICATGILLPAANGQLARIVGTVSDISDRKRIEAELRESELRFRSVQESSPDGAMLLRAVRDEEGRITDFLIAYANASAHRILLDSVDERIVGRTVREAFPESLERFSMYQRVVETGEPEHHDAFYVRHDRRRGLRLAVVRSDDGVHISFGDLSERLAAAEERERMLAAERAAHAEADRARREAEQANAVKAQFLATMSHELRTPLNAIGGYAQLIELGVHGPVTPGQAESLARIQRSQKHLLGLINEVLSYAKLEAGAVTFHSCDVPAMEIARGVEALVAPQAREKSIVLQVEASEPDLVVHADPEKARQVVLNLLSNAIKFTASGGRVTLRCAPGTPTAAGAPTVELCVQDTGRGIRADQIERVFEPFVQVGRELTSQQSGTGLGLAISRDLARRMGGEIVATSTEGVGSTFVLTLPRA